MCLLIYIVNSFTVLCRAVTATHVSLEISAKVKKEIKSSIYNHEENQSLKP